MRGLHWFRGDLRLHDNTALSALCSRVEQWLPVFILDPRFDEDSVLGQRRHSFLLDCLEHLQEDLRQRGVPFLLRRGEPHKVVPELMHQTGARLLSFNEDTTPYARRRDDAVERAVTAIGGKVLVRTDRVVFRASEIQTAAGKSYGVYSPYRTTWWKRWQREPRPSTPGARLPAAIPGFATTTCDGVVALESLRTRQPLPTGGEVAARQRLRIFLETAVANYHVDRDRPDVDGTSRLSPYLRFGVLSVRECFERGLEAAAQEPPSRPGVAKWLDELVWRDFYAAILEENPRVLRHNHRREFDAVKWNEDDEGFEAWCQGRTGFPVVDAGMRQLRETGWMHNRMRMVTASFLTKDLLIDWRRGERFFFEQLVDGDPASNSGGWQWAASTGTDAQPYFRIFNPTLQGKRWDPKGNYVRRWVPELSDVPAASIHAPTESIRPKDYPSPILDHAQRRVAAMERFQAARPSRSRPPLFLQQGGGQGN